MTDAPTSPTDGESSPLIAMTPADAGLYLAGLARAEAERAKDERNWEGFANLCAHMIQQAFEAGAASVQPAAITLRNFVCKCSEPAPQAIVDAADLEPGDAVLCPRCGRAMTEVAEG